jgi:hypothetical protein
VSARVHRYVRSTECGGLVRGQGLTLVHLSAQRKRCWWVKGYLGGVKGELKAGVQGVLRRLGDVLTIRNGSV